MTDGVKSTESEGVGPSIGSFFSSTGGKSHAGVQNDAPIVVAAVAVDDDGSLGDDDVDDKDG